MSGDAESSIALHKLREADALLAEGVHRIMGVASQIPGATQPLLEVLRMSEQQAMSTMEAVESGLRWLQQIEDTARNGGYIDDKLHGLRADLRSILTSQQAQDLAGQRLKKTIALLQAVELRVQEAMHGLGTTHAEPKQADAATPDTARLQQCDVDDLLSSLGI